MAPRSGSCQRAQPPRRALAWRRRASLARFAFRLAHWRQICAARELEGVLSETSWSCQRSQSSRVCSTAQRGPCMSGSTHTWPARRSRSSRGLAVLRYKSPARIPRPECGSHAQSHRVCNKDGQTLRVERLRKNISRVARGRAGQEVTNSRTQGVSLV